MHEKLQSTSCIYNMILLSIKKSVTCNNLDKPQKLMLRKISKQQKST